MLGSIQGEVRFKEPLSFHTALRIGGPSDVFVMPRDTDDIRHALRFAEREQMPVMVLGGGNNVLVRDKGIRGLTIKLDGFLRRIEFYGEEAVVGAAANLFGFIREAAAVDLGGIECLAGIPASVGGALVTDASGTDGAISDFVTSVYFLQQDGSLDEVKLRVGSQRLGRVVVPEGAILLGCRIRLRRRPRTDIHKDINKRLKLRKRTEPLGLASTKPWADPDGRDSAADLIEKARLKGKRINAVEISTKHPNFIVNRGHASAADVLALMDMTREAVQARSGVTLTPAVRIVGE